MYFLTDEEKKRLLKGFLPKSRENGVADELRGWNWHQPPLEPVYDCHLALYEVAGKYCPTGRDLYLKKVEHIVAGPNLAMIQGAIMHELMVNILVAAKKMIYNLGVPKYKEICRALNELPVQLDARWKSQLTDGQITETMKKAEILRDFECPALLPGFRRF